MSAQKNSNEVTSYNTGFIWDTGLRDIQNQELWRRKKTDLIKQPHLFPKLVWKYWSIPISANDVINSGLNFSHKS